MAQLAHLTRGEVGSNTASASAAAPVTTRRFIGILAPLCVLLVLWVYLFSLEGAFSGGPNGKTFGADFAMFMGAARVMAHGGNPYDHHALFRAERSWMAEQHLKMLTTPEVVRVGNPPQLFWAMRPLTDIPFQAVAYAWMALLYGLSALGFFLLLRAQGWRRKIIPTVIFLLMPQVVLGAFYGNVTALVFIGVCVALTATRRHPEIAGCALALAWLKPQVGLPIVMLVLLFHAPHRRKTVTGFVVATTAFFGLGLVAAGPHMMVLWIQGLLAYSRDVGSSPSIASFAGLYVRLVPHAVRLSIEGLSVAVAMIVTILAWRQARDHAEVLWIRVGWLWALWFLAAPYAHFFDEILLAGPVLALLGSNARYLGDKESAIALYMAFASLLVLSTAPMNIQLLWIPLLVVMLVLYHVSWRRPSGVPLNSKVQGDALIGVVRP